MEDQTNEEPPDPMPGTLPDTTGRSGTAPAWHGGKHGAAPVDPDALFRQVLDGANLKEIWIRLHYGDQPKSKGTSKLVI